jgi:beta-aspartyl-dipeptidase (metallo-type)
MITLIRNVLVFTPKEIGSNDVLVMGEQIARIAPDLEVFANLPDIRIIDGKEHYLTPGFIDQHVHILGGGGAAGFGSRGPELNFSEAMLAGTTTVVGCVGVDQIGRDLKSLLAKTRSLEVRGMTAFMFTGGFDWRVTMTGSVENDLFFIDKVIGAKVAISEHRSPQPSQDQLNQLISETMVGGLLSGKAGALQVHMGTLPRGIAPLVKAIKDTGVPIKHVLPTHMHRKHLLEQISEWIDLGGVVDLTAPSAPANMLKKLLSSGIPLDKITLSTDGNGVPTRGGFDKIERVPLNLLHKRFKELVLDEGIAVSDALKFSTANVARVLCMERKGVVEEGADADLLLLDPQSLEIEVVMARGEVMVQNGKLLKMQKLDV